MISSPFTTLYTEKGYYIIAPSLSSQAIGPFASRQIAREKATEWNRKYRRDGVRKTEREMMMKEASADGALRPKE